MCMGLSSPSLSTEMMGSVGMTKISSSSSSSKNDHVKTRFPPPVLGKMLASIHMYYHARPCIWQHSPLFLSESRSTYRDDQTMHPHPPPPPQTMVLPWHAFSPSNRPLALQCHPPLVYLHMVVVGQRGVIDVWVGWPGGRHQYRHPHHHFDDPLLFPVYHLL